MGMKRVKLWKWRVYDLFVLGRLWGVSGQTLTQTLLFFIDLDMDSDSKGIKFLDADSNPESSNLMGLGSLMGLKKSV